MNVNDVSGQVVDAAMNVHALRAAKVFKICDRKKTDVGRIVPFITKHPA